MSDGPVAADLPPVAPGTVLVVESGEGLLKQILFDGRHRLVADEPLAAGGSDAGPNPYELLLMSLGACTAMTLRLYARRKQWPLERVAVRLTHARIHAEDCAECETRSGFVDRIEREIELAGPLDAAQRARLMAIAEMCPVHRTLTSEISIQSRLADA
ncbi:MAG TPA: OsmC family protein [Stellaceae bacterium]|jgi:putative redox protein|nr:OsmC family protein [Stellaceae bacterium]